MTRTRRRQAWLGATGLSAALALCALDMTPAAADPSVTPQLPAGPGAISTIRRGADGQIMLAPNAAPAAPTTGEAPRTGILNPLGPRTLRVGPDRTLKLPSAAAATAADGDTVEIEAGSYDDCAVWRASRLSIVGLGAGAVFTGKTCAGKGIFVISGDDVAVRNVTFANAKVADGNGAGIRAEGRNLTVEDSRFLQNEDGILTNPSPDGNLIVRRSSFIGNGVCNPSCAHGIYAGAIALLKVEHSTFFETREGHHIKSRALDTELFDNSIRDGEKGTSSYLVELPNGGSLTMQGNTLEKGPRAQNETAAVSIGAEGNLHPTDHLIIEGNSFTNDMAVRTAFVKNLTSTPARLAQNTYKGRIVPLSGPGSVSDVLPAEGYGDQLKDLGDSLKQGLKQKLK